MHCSFSRVGPVENGPAGLIAALQSAVGPGGTLVMPSMTDDDEHIFEPERTPCLGMGVVADTFWRLPGVRSDSPHAFAARGPFAASITAPQPADIPPTASTARLAGYPSWTARYFYWVLVTLQYNHPPGREYVRCAVQAQEHSYSERWPASTPGLC